MAWTKIGASTAYHSASSDTVTLEPHNSTAENDFMLAIIATYLYSDAETGVPSGWTKIDSNSTTNLMGYTAIYYKVAGSSESSASYDWIWSAARKRGGVIITYRGGFDTSDPIDVYSNTAYGTNDTNLRAATATASANSSPAIHIGGVYNPSALSFTPPTDYSEDYDSGSTTSDLWFSVNSDVISAGATGDVDSTISSSEANKHAFLVILNPTPPITIEIGTGSFSYSGSALNFGKALHLTTGTDPYSYTGQDITFSRALLATLEIGTFSYSGVELDFSKSLGLVTSGGTYSYSGGTVDFAEGKALLAEEGSFSYSGSDLSFTKTLSLVLDTGTYSYNGSSVILEKGQYLSFDGGTFSLSGSDLTFGLEQDDRFLPETGTFTVEVESVALTKTLRSIRSINIENKNLSPGTIDSSRYIVKTL